MIFSKLKSRTRTAFTLIELVLALALSAVLVYLLGQALSVGSMRAMENHEQVDKARLVESVVALVRSDLHQAVIYEPQDTANEMQLAEASAEFDVDSIDSITEMSGGSGGGSSSSSSSSSQSTSLRRPLGVYGTLQELEINVLREHAQFEIDNEGTVVAPTSTSGITTVRYGMGNGAGSLGVTGVGSSESAGVGLVRQEVHRDLLNWAEQIGSTAQLVGMPQLVAPEVTALEFRYFDGAQLLETWDSELMEGQLPVAIEMRIAFADNEVDRRGNVVAEQQSLPFVITIALSSTWNYVDPALVTPADDANSTSTSSDSSAGGDR